MCFIPDGACSLGDNVGNIFKNYVRNSDGHIGLTFAIMSVPLLLAVGVAIDSSRAMNEYHGMQEALDAAALAAVLPGNVSTEQRKRLAVETFNTNFPSHDKVKLDINAAFARVDITGSMVQQNIIMGITGKDEISVVNTSSAVRTQEDTICVMTLDPVKRGSLHIEKDAFLSAPGCSVQVNSNSEQAIISTAIKPLEVKSICTAGESAGNLPNNIKNQCAIVSDPYASFEAPVSSGCDYGPISLFSLSSYQDIMSAGAKDKVLKPGIYCDGLHIYDSSVTFEPGVYVIQGGPLTIGNNSTVKGDGVTFIFKGEGSVLYTYDEVTVDLTAPAEGPYAGLLFFQDRASSVDETSIIKGGVNMNLVGTMYFPTQNLFVGGVGNMGSSSPAMAFIAKNITFTSDIEAIVTQNEANILQLKNMLEFAITLGGDLGLTNYRITPGKAVGKDSLKTSFNTTISTDHSAAGLPPILPRSDAGARLISN